MRRPMFQTFNMVGLAALAAMPIVSASARADDSKDARIAALQKRIDDQARQIAELTRRLEAIERKGSSGPQPVQPAARPTPAPSTVPPVPEAAIPGEQPGIPPVVTAPSSAGTEAPPIPEPSIPEGTEGPAPSSMPTAGTTRASLLPDLSVIGNNIGRFISVRGDHSRNRLQLAEVELGLQQPVYTGIRFDAFLNGDAGGGFQIGAEEAYATFSKLGGLPLGAYLGRKRIDFGKINPVHPHARLFVDQPAPLTNFLGTDGLGGNGASVNYTLPVTGLFANMELGLWKVEPATDLGMRIGQDVTPTFYPLGLGVTNNFPVARLWISKTLGSAGELELGASDGFGRADVGDRINLSGVDFTYRRFPGTFSRWLVQGEALWHRRRDDFGHTGGHSRSGQYLLLAYRPDQYLEYGLRLDGSQYPWPIPGHDRSASLIWTRRLTEATLLRLQYKYGSRTSSVYLPASKGYNEAYLQFIWAAGSHTHPLQ